MIIPHIEQDMKFLGLYIYELFLTMWTCFGTTKAHWI